MGLYAANFKNEKLTTTTTTIVTTPALVVDEKVRNVPDKATFWSPNPTTELWDDNDDDNDTDDGGGWPSPEYRINCRYAIAAASDGTKNSDKHSKPDSLPSGHDTFPPLFLLRFLWRNFIVGPRVDPKTDFNIPLASSVTMRPK